ncbi:30S ribosomal protein S21 [Candidatus Mycoplasma haematominutum]|uniref:Small ribosomal subunit protein bS21 n=1 Tax=Candidatus Mycoplasma haematominutum 'Birmingham 1' TaxID=1116213 RepID=G8C348_9MOLU|nr:30S ribosomal protein S21 [Candidatus Mycoplasma haematominutum]CCE66746.1 ribosomal protein S21 [Candidatus Mycoplasma haematominutum 'Birmingham 1']
MPVIKVRENNIEQAMFEFRRLSTEVKRSAMKYLYHLRPALKRKEKKKRADMRRKFY